MPIPLIALIEDVPDSTLEEVERAKKKFNRTVRELLRLETRLNFNVAASSERREERENRSVRVFVTPGIPRQLVQVTFEEHLLLAIKLAPLRRTLETALGAINDLRAPLAEMSHGYEFLEKFPNAVESLAATRISLSALLQEAARENLLKKIFGFKTDVLGQYTYHSPLEAPQDEAEPTAFAKADLFWGVIGLVAQMIGIKAEALTVVVLAHELAHAYTHLGTDADGKTWDTTDFGSADLGLVEGLAQYYTFRVLQRMSDKIPCALEAYRRLLPHQPPEYSTQLRWLEEYSPEVIRFAMISLRRSGERTLAEFDVLLEQGRQQLCSK